LLSVFAANFKTATPLHCTSTDMCICMCVCVTINKSFSLLAEPPPTNPSARRLFPFCIYVFANTQKVPSLQLHFQSVFMLHTVNTRRGRPLNRIQIDFDFISTLLSQSWHSLGMKDRASVMLITITHHPLQKQCTEKKLNN